MDLSKISQERLEVLNRIKEYEKQGKFDEDVENDPPAPELLPDKVDYLCKKFSSKIGRKIANIVGDKYFLNLIKKDILIIDGVKGEEHLSVLKDGAMLTCNHFAPSDNYILFHCVRKYLPKKIPLQDYPRKQLHRFPGYVRFFV